MSKTNNKSTPTRIVTYILFAALILGALAAILYIIYSPNGLYVTYGSQTLTADNNGITIEWSSDSPSAEFTIGNTDGWGVYSVQDCTVKVVANVSDECDFEFTVNGKTELYSLEDDLTAAFVEDYTTYDGSGLIVDEDGNFSLYIDPAYCDSQYGFIGALDVILYRVYGAQVITNSTASGYTYADISEYPYLALLVTAPSGHSITIPFVIESADTVEYYITSTRYGEDYSCLVSHPDTAAAGETVTVTVTVDEGELTNIEVKTSDGETITTTYEGSGSYSFTMPSASVVIILYFNGATG